MSALHVAGAGARTSMGRSLKASAVAARARLAEFVDHPFMIDESGFPMTVARDPSLDEGLARDQRLAQLAAAAADEACAALEPQGRLRARLLLALPGCLDPDIAAVDVDHVAAAVRGVLRDRLDITAQSVSQRGHVAGIEAVQAALAQPFDGWTLLVGADSWLDAATLEWLDAEQLLRVRSRPFGFVPGEAAAALLLTPRAGAATILSINAAAIASEAPEALARDQPRLGRALSRAARTVLADAPYATRTLCADLNGLPGRADEVGYTVLRVREHLHDELQSLTPAEWFGDVGAASVPLALALAAAAPPRTADSVPGSTLLLAQSLGADRGALRWTSSGG